MKKIFTLVAMALSMSLGVNAQEQLAFDGNTWGWSQLTVVMNSLITAQQYGGIDLGAPTDGKCKSVTIEYTGMTGTWQMAITTDKENPNSTASWNKYIAVYKQANETMATEGTATFDIEAAMNESSEDVADNSITKLFIQAASAGAQINISKITINYESSSTNLTEADVTPTSVANGTTTYAMAPCTLSFKQWGGPYICDSEGKQITYTTGAGEDVYTYTIEFDGDIPSGMQIVGNSTATTDAWKTSKYIQISSSAVSFKVDDSFMPADAPDGKMASLMIQSSGSDAVSLTIKSATRIKEGSTAIETIKATNAMGNNAYYNLSGQRVEKPSKGIYIHNGKKIVF